MNEPPWYRYYVLSVMYDERERRLRRTADFWGGMLGGLVVGFLVLLVSWFLLG